MDRLRFILIVPGLFLAARAAASDGAAEAIDRVLEKEGERLAARCGALLDHRLESMASAPAAMGATLRHWLEDRRKEEGLDFLALLHRGARPGEAAFLLSGDDLAARARAEEDPALRELAGEILESALQGGEEETEGAPRARQRGSQFLSLPSWILPRGVAGEGDPAGAILLVSARKAGKKTALLCAMSLRSISNELVRAAVEGSGSRTTAWSAFAVPFAPLARASAARRAQEAKERGGEEEAAPGAARAEGRAAVRIAAGEGIGLTVPKSLVEAMESEERARWPARESGGPATFARTEWQALRGPGGRLAGGIAAVTTRSLAWGDAGAAGVSGAASDFPAWNSAPGILTGVLLVLVAITAFLSLRAGRRCLRARDEEEALRRARLTLQAECRSLATGLVDPRRLSPLLAHSVDRALAKIRAAREDLEPAASDPRGKGPTAAAAPTAVVHVGVALLEEVAASLPNALFGVNDKGEIFLWNHAAELLWGGKASERKGKELAKLDLGGPDEEIRRRVGRALRDGVAGAAQISLERGEVRHIELMFLPLRALRGALVVATDTTRLSEYETSSRIHEECTRAILSSLPVPFFAIDAQDRVSLWSAAAAKLTGLSEPDALGKDHRSLPIQEARRAARRLAAAGNDPIGTLFVLGPIAEQVASEEEVAPETPPEAAPVAAAAQEPAAVPAEAEPTAVAEPAPAAAPA